MSRMIIVEGNSNDKDNVRVIMVKGEQGYSAYDLYVQKGGTLTEEQWLDQFLNAENYYNKDEVDSLIENEATLRDEADTTLQTNIDNEATTRSNADTTLQNNINAETTSRQNADSDLTTALAIERARIDSIASLPSGSTKGDAELIDGRIDFESFTYPSIGDCIRGEAKELYNYSLIEKPSNISEIFVNGTPNNLINKYKLYKGYCVNYANGKKLVNESFAITPFIDISEISELFGHDVGLSAFYDSNKSFISYANVTGMSGQVTIPNNTKYIRCSVLLTKLDTAILCEGTSLKTNDNGMIKTKKENILLNNGELFLWTKLNIIENKFIFPKRTTFQANNGKYLLINASQGTEITLAQGDILYVDYDFNENKTVTDFSLIKTTSNSDKFFTLAKNIGGNILSNVRYINESKKYLSVLGDPPYDFFTVPVNQVLQSDIVSNTSNAIVDNENDIVDVNCYIALPTNYTQDGKPCKLCMICHGAGRGIDPNNNGWLSIIGYIRILSALLSNGYAVFDCNGYNNSDGVSFWGSPRGVEAWRKAYNYITKNYNVEHDFYIYGFSMGGLTALELINELYPNIRCVALGSPVSNLKYSYDNGSETRINIAYNMTSWDNEKVKGCAPENSIITIDNVEYYNKPVPPIKMWYGSTETNPSKTDGQRLINAMRNNNSYAWYREVTGAGHEICYGENLNVINEIITWLNRF